MLLMNDSKKTKREFVQNEAISVSYTSFKCVFSPNCYLAAPQATLGHYHGGSLIHPMLITAFYTSEPEVTRSLIRRLGP